MLAGKTGQWVFPTRWVSPPATEYAGRKKRAVRNAEAHVFERWQGMEREVVEGREESSICQELTSQVRPSMGILLGIVRGYEELLSRQEDHCDLGG